MRAPKILEEEMKIIRGKWLGFKIHRIQAQIWPWEWNSPPLYKACSVCWLVSVTDSPSPLVTQKIIVINHTNSMKTSNNTSRH